MSKPCTARIKNQHSDEHCVLEAGHVDPEYGTDHAGPKHPVGGRLRWNDSADGAVPHQPGQEDLDAEPSDGPWCCNGNAEDCALCTDPNPPYPFLCPGHPRTSANERIVGEATQATNPRPFGERSGLTSPEVASSLYTIHGSAISAVPVPPQTISIHGSNGPLVTIHLDDGRLEYGPGYTPDEAARLFWEALRSQVNPMEQAFGRPLIETINEHLAAGEAAEKRARELEAEVTAARTFAGEMRDFCSPHGVAVDYADRLVEAMDRAKEGRA